LIFERHNAVMKTSNGMRGRKEDEQALLGKRECGGPVVVVVVVVVAVVAVEIF
jgi:hypothetical protein